MTLFLGFSAVNTGNNLLYLIVSSFLGYMGISGFFGRRNLSRIKVDLELPEEIYARRPAPVRVRVGNAKRFFPGFLLRIGIGEEEALFPYVEGASKAVRHANLTFDRRGRFRIESVRVCSVFPFNFFIRCRKVGNPVDLIVFPEPKKCEIMSPFRHRGRSKGELSSGKTGYDSETLSIRNYLHGDPLKYVSWKATAKTDELKTRELSSLSSQPVVVDLAAIPAEGVEDRVSCAAYMVLHLMKRGTPVGLRIGGRLHKPDLSTAHRNTLMRELALYGKGE